MHLINTVLTVGTEQVDQLGVDLVIIDELGELWEVPGEPLLQPHAESVDIFVKLLDQGNSLDDWLILTVNIGSALVSGVAVTKTELCSLDIVLVDFY